MTFWISLPGLAGFVVAVTWIVSAISGPWPHRLDACDMPGVVIGWSWIAMAAVSEVGMWCFAMNQ